MTVDTIAGDAEEHRARLHVVRSVGEGPDRVRAAGARPPRRSSYVPGGSASSNCPKRTSARWRGAMGDDPGTKGSQAGSDGPERSGPPANGPLTFRPGAA